MSWIEDDFVDRLEQQLTELAYQWRGIKDENSAEAQKIVDEYHRVFA